MMTITCLGPCVDLVVGLVKHSYAKKKKKYKQICWYFFNTVSCNDSNNVVFTSQKTDYFAYCNGSQVYSFEWN